MLSLISKHSLGIEITDTHVKLCELRWKLRNPVRISHYARVELPEGTMNDGRIQDEKLLIQALHKVLDIHPWSKRHVHLAIPSQTVMVRFLKMPQVNDKELRKIIDFEIKNNIHLPFDDPYYDFVRLEKQVKTATRKIDTDIAAQAKAEIAAANAVDFTNPFSKEPMEEQETSTCDVMLTAASLELLQQYTRIFKELDLQLASIEIKPFSLNRVHQRVMKLPPEALVLLADVTNTNCDLTIIRDGYIKITRNVPVSFLTAEGQSEASIDQMFTDLEPHAHSYEHSFNELAGELERLMNFYRYTLNHREAEFNHLVVTGDIPMMEQLLLYLRNRLPQQVTAMGEDELLGVGHNPDWSLSAYAVPLGLSLRGRA